MKKALKLSLIFIFLGLLAACDSPKKMIEKQASDDNQITIYLTRHGKTMLNTTDRVQGWCDAPLTNDGIKVAENVGKGINDSIKFDKVYSSDSGRAIETANTILKAAKQKVDVTQDKRLREFNFGTYEGKLNDEMWGDVAEENGQTLEDYKKDLSKNGIANGIKNFANTLAKIDSNKAEQLKTYSAEEFKTVSTRMKNMLNDIVKDAKETHGKNILVVSHGMSIMALIASLDPNEANKIPATGLANASISKIVFKDGDYTVKSVNDTSYSKTGEKIN